MEKDAVDDQYGTFGRLEFGRIDRAVGNVIERRQPISSRTAAIERPQKPLHERGIVVGIEIESVWRFAPATIAHDARMMKIVDAGTNDDPALPADDGTELVGEEALAGAVDTVDTDTGDSGAAQVVDSPRDAQQRLFARGYGVAASERVTVCR